MINSKKSVLLIFSCFLCAVSVIQSANAQDNSVADDYGKYNRGFYADLNVGWPHIVDSSIISVSDYSTWRGIGVNPDVGYQFNKYVALEGGYTFIRVFDKSVHLIDGAVRLSLPIHERFNLFAKLGGTYGTHKDWDSDTRHKGYLYYGLGAAYKITSQLDLQAQFNTSDDPFETFSLLSCGIAYHF